MSQELIPNIRSTKGKREFTPSNNPRPEIEWMSVWLVGWLAGEGRARLSYQHWSINDERALPVAPPLEAAALSRRCRDGASQLTGSQLSETSPGSAFSIYDLSKMLTQSRPHK